MRGGSRADPYSYGSCCRSEQATAKQGSIPCTRYLFAVFWNPPVLPGNAEIILVWSLSRLEIAASSTGGCRRRERSMPHWS